MINIREQVIARSLLDYQERYKAVTGQDWDSSDVIIRSQKSLEDVRQGLYDTYFGGLSPAEKIELINKLTTKTGKVKAPPAEKINPKGSLPRRQAS